MRPIQIACLVIPLFIACKQQSKQAETPPTSTVDLQPIKDSLTTELQSIYNQKHTVGFGIAMVDPESILYNQGFGFRNTATQQPYTPTTVQPIASISKTILGITVLKAQEIGALHLDDPIQKYLPFEISNPNAPTQQITIRHLATHTSTIQDTDAFWENTYVLHKETHPKGVSVFGYMKPPSTKKPLGDFLAQLLAKEGALYTPKTFTKDSIGSTFEYSNLGAALCGYVIEIATKRPYHAFTKTHIFDPLQMQQTTWSHTAIDSTQRSKLYGNYESVLADYSLQSYPDGGLLTTSKDMSYLLMELINGYNGQGKLLNTESYKELFTPQLTPAQLKGKRNGSLGLFTELSNGFMGDTFKTIGHSGGDPGIVAGMYFNPTTGIGRILLFNTDADFDEEIIPQFKTIWKLADTYSYKLQ